MNETTYPDPQSLNSTTICGYNSAVTADQIKRRILVVDDNRDSSMSLSMLLNLTGNVTEMAFDGVSAIDVAATFLPDVILLDIGLPKLNGFEVCRRIRQQEWGKSILMIALTGWSQESDREQSLDAGFDVHLTKPVEYDKLRALLAERLPGSA